MLLDPWLYENLKNGNQAYLCTLESVLVTVPKAAMDEYGIRLGDTEWYRLYPVLANLPEDTVLCLANPLQIGKSSNETEYLHSKEMFAVLAESELKTAS